MNGLRTIKLLLVAAAFCALPGLAAAGTAKLQIIHNSADPAAAVVDIYVNGDLLLDDFAFRAATPFVEVPADVQLDVGVAPGDSGSPNDVIATFPVTLASGGSYVAVANGVLTPAGFAPNPDGRSTGFTIFAAADVKTRSWLGTVALRAMHGATDAPAVDIRARRGSWSTTLYGNVGYGDIGRTRYVLATDYLLEVTLPGQPSAVVASYRVDLSPLARGAAFIFASGFLTPADNQDGPAFGLFAALPDGTVLPLGGSDSSARLQVIHNAADPAAAEVDVYVNGERLLDDFAFRAATPFIDVPAGVELVVGIAPGTSASADDIIAEFPLTLTAGESYVAMATGVLDPSAFAGNPQGRGIGFTVQPFVGAREAGVWSFVALNAFHGATDAPAVDIRRQSYWFDFSYPLFSNLGYGEFSGYQYMLPRKVDLDVTLPGQPRSVVATFTADLRGLSGGAAVVFASGFLNPDANQGGAGFGLFAALPDGRVIALPAAAAKDADADKADVPFVAQLDQNYPNPFNPTTTIAFTLPRDGRVRLQVFDLRGRMVAEVLDEVRPAGRNEVTFDGTRLASGMYFYRINAGDFEQVRQMTLVK